MTIEEVGHLRGSWKEIRGATQCSHDRLVDYIYNEKGKRMKGTLVCRQCGRIFFENQKDQAKKGGATADYSTKQCPHK